MVCPMTIMNSMQGRQTCAPAGNQPLSPLLSSNYLLFGILPRLFARKGVMLLTLNTSARSKVAEPSPEDESLYRHDSVGTLQFLRHKLELHSLSVGNGCRIGT